VAIADHRAAQVRPVDRTPSGHPVVAHTYLLALDGFSTNEVLEGGFGGVGVAWGTSPSRSAGPRHLGRINAGEADAGAISASERVAIGD
jgi:hypothetical protein